MLLSKKFFFKFIFINLLSLLSSHFGLYLNDLIEELLNFQISHLMNKIFQIHINEVDIDLSPDDYSNVLRTR